MRIKLAVASFAVALLSMAGAAEADCVYGETDNVRHYIVNNCSRPVTAAFRSDSGFTGATGNISPGRRAQTSVSSQYGMRFNWCYVSDWNSGACALNYY